MVGFDCPTCDEHFFWLETGRWISRIVGKWSRTLEICRFYVSWSIDEILSKSPIFYCIIMYILKIKLLSGEQQ